MGLFLNLAGTTRQSFGIKDTDASHFLNIVPGSNLTANRTLSLVTGDADRTITLSGNPTLNDWFDQSVKAAASPTFVSLSVGSSGIRLLESYIPGLNYLTIRTDGQNLTADRTLYFNVNDADRTISLSGSPTLDDWFDQSVKIAAQPIFSNVNVKDASYPNLNLINASATANNNLLGGINFRDLDSQTYAAIKGFVDGTPGNNDYPGRIIFYTTPDGSTTLTERMRITSAGVVLFDGGSGVAHGVTAFGCLTSTYCLIDRYGTDGGAVLRGFSDAADVPGLYMMGLIGVADPADSIAAVYIVGAKKSGTAGVELGATETVLQVYNYGTHLFTVLGNSNVGINTALPYEKLEVYGAISATGNMAGQTAQGPATTMSFSSDGYGEIQTVDWGTAYKDLVLNRQGGNVGVGMIPTNKFSVNGPIRTGVVKHNFFNYTNVDSVSTKFIHMKTNQPCNGGTAGPMLMVEFLGYNYGYSQIVDCTLAWYSYLGTINSISNNGSNGCSCYISSDGYIVMTMFFQQSIYYLGFIANLYAMSPQGWFDLTIVAAAYYTYGNGYY